MTMFIVACSDAIEERSICSNAQTNARIWQPHPSLAKLVPPSKAGKVYPDLPTFWKVDFAKQKTDEVAVR